MRYPTPGDYQDALQVPQVAFTDPTLQQAELETTALGLPRVITGAFAAVFQARTRTRCWAVKCFLTEVRDQAARYEAIARHLREAARPYTVAFDYQPAGIRVDGQTWPLLKMAWVEGTPLNAFVAAHRATPEVLDELAARWRRMLADLEAAGIAHGDLQHGNVLVAGEPGDLQLRLVDYDTMFVPALAGRKSPEVGHRNFQHPDRDEGDFGPYLDRFAGLAVYVALRACRQDPALWTRYDTGENLLFRAADFFDPDASPLMQDLARLDALAPLVAALRQACYLEPERVPTLEAVLEGNGPATPGGASLRRLQRRRAARSPRRPTRRPLADRLFAPALVVLAAAAVAFGALGWTLPLLASLGLGGVLIGLSVHRYRRLPVVRRRHRLRREVHYIDRTIDRLRQEIERLQHERTSFVHRTDTLRAERLAELRDERLAHHLKHHFVGTASSFDGITHKVVVRLKAAGIRTAYQATPERLAAVKGISDESRARVGLWRAALAAEVQDDLPEALSPAEERRFQRRIHQHLSALDEEIERLREKIRVQDVERRQVLERASALPAVTYPGYLGYLLRLRALPALHPPRTTPTPSPPQPTEPQPTPSPTPEPPPTRPWWETHPQPE
ncbi:hypothetical protein AWN76_001070 [Rhodothermaceae bacterium RA]|nr:hypothetical protein AWN76_001070 [Rhodothermaceae bacterium RA]